MGPFTLSAVFLSGCIKILQATYLPRKRAGSTCITFVEIELLKYNKVGLFYINRVVCAFVLNLEAHTRNGSCLSEPEINFFLRILVHPCGKCGHKHVLRTENIPI